MKPTFELGADATIEKVQATYKQRGGEYADSWHTENLVTTFLDATLRRMNVDVGLGKEEKRLILLAALIDVKDSRMGGPWKEDSVVDGIAYRALYANLMETYKGSP